MSSHSPENTWEHRIEKFLNDPRNDGPTAAICAVVLGTMLTVNNYLFPAKDENGTEPKNPPAAVAPLNPGTAEKISENADDKKSKERALVTEENEITRD